MSFRRILNDFNTAIRFHNQIFPIGFDSPRVDSGDNNHSNNSNIDECGVIQDDGVSLNGVESRKPRKVLILMSDTGGGHRASAEAIRAAFYEEFGDQYQVCFCILHCWVENDKIRNRNAFFV